MNTSEDFASRPELKELTKKYWLFLSLFVLFSIVGLIITVVSVFFLNVDLNLIYIGVSFVFISFIFVLITDRYYKKYEIKKSEFIKSNASDVGKDNAPLPLYRSQIDPEKMKWERYRFISRLIAGNIERIRIRITQNNISEEMRETLDNAKYNFDNEPPEIIGLITQLQQISDSAGLNIKINKMIENTDLKGSFVKYLEPYEFELPITDFSLSLTLSLQEIQWNLIKNSKRVESLDFINSFKPMLLESMKIFIRNGNRI